MLSVLYLYSGKARVGDLAHCLKDEAKKFGKKAVVLEVDMLKGKKNFNMRNKNKRNAIKKEVIEGGFHAVVASPPCSTFSRARTSGFSGPQPLRSKGSPRGFSWLGARAKASVRDANLLVDFAFEILELQAKFEDKFFLLEHPEDLGTRNSGRTPASIWQLQQARGLGALPGAVCGALRQEDWGVGYPKPTRFLGRWPGLQEILHIGDPCFDEKGQYKGPLPKKIASRCSSARTAGASRRRARLRGRRICAIGSPRCWYRAATRSRRARL